MTATAEVVNHPSLALDVSDIIEGLVDSQMLHLPLDTISVRDGFNPRRYFSPEKMTELVESIKAQGLIQPIVVKPNTDGTGFHLIAGERRFRASTLAKIESVPVIVRLVNDEEALALAVAENSEREDVSAGEEAKACHRMMAICSGDKDETARALGWSRKKLDSRLMLLHCSDQVLNALEERKILIGHAELLSGLSKEMQDQTITGVIEQKVSVTVLREKLGRYAYKLNEACFDTSACTGCPHNSSCTADLFDQSLNDGHCMNRECYDQKTTSHLQQKKTELTEEYPVIWLDIERPADTRCHLVREGSNGVGKAQFSACQGCGNYGAVMSTEKGNEGQVEQGVCFDTVCNKTKVADYAQQLNDEQPQEVASTTKTDRSITSTPKNPKTKTAAKVPSVETPKKVKLHVAAKQFDACANEVISNVQMIKIFSLISLMETVRNSRSTHLVEPLLKQIGLDKANHIFRRSDMVNKLATLEESSLNELIRTYTATMAGAIRINDSMLEGEDLETSKTVLSLVNADMTKYIQVDKAYLDTLTISGLKALLDESGFVAWYEEKHGEDSCGKKLLKGTRDKQIKAVMEAGFDWTGFVPKSAHLPDLKATVKQY